MVNEVRPANSDSPSAEELETARAMWRKFDLLSDQRRDEFMQEIDQVETSGGVVKRLEGASAILGGKHVPEGKPEKSIADMSAEELTGAESEIRNKLQMLENILDKEAVGLGMFSWELKRYFEKRLEEIQRRLTKK